MTEANVHSQTYSGGNTIKRRRRGRNMVPRLALGFGRLPSSAHPAVAPASRSARGGPVQFLVKIFFQISVPPPLSVAKVWRGGRRYKEKFTEIFSGAEKHANFT